MSALRRRIGEVRSRKEQMAGIVPCAAGDWSEAACPVVRLAASRRRGSTHTCANDGVSGDRRVLTVAFLIDHSLRL